MEYLEEEQAETRTKKPNLLLMITNPVENFKRMRNEPTWIVPLIIIVLLLTIISLAIIKLTFTDTFLEAELGVLFEGDESIEEGLFYFAAITAIISIFITIPLLSLLKALIFFIVGKITSSPATFKQYFSLTVHVAIIGVLGGLTGLLYNTIVSGVHPEFVFTSLQAIVNADGVASIIFSTIELFAIWQLIITAIGLQIVTRIPKKTAWITVIVLFILSLGIGIGSFYLNEFTNSLLI